MEDNKVITQDVSPISFECNSIQKICDYVDGNKKLPDILKDLISKIYSRNDGNIYIDIHKCGNHTITVKYQNYDIKSGGLSVFLDCNNDRILEPRVKDALRKIKWPDYVDASHIDNLIFKIDINKALSESYKNKIVVNTFEKESNHYKIYLTVSFLRQIIIRDTNLDFILNF